MVIRSKEDELRCEYFDLLPKMRKLLQLLEAKIKWLFHTLSYNLKDYEQLEIVTRLKDCESAIESLSRKKHKQGERVFDNQQLYSLTELNDLIGIRILVFPVSLIISANEIICSNFTNWKSDHEKHGEMQILKFQGFLAENEKIKCEIQIVSLLTGRFWDVEHSALYKPHPNYKNIKDDFKMKRLYNEVLNKLAEFEKSFEQVIKDSYFSK